MYERALVIRPASTETEMSLGHALHESGRLTEGIAACRRALYLNPDLAMAHFNLALMLLAQGNFAEGWKEYEWRWKLPDHWPPARDFGKPRWDGGDLRGGRILLHAEQGFGDTIQFIRFLRLVTGRGGEAIVECQPQLADLLRSMPGVAHCLAHGERLPDFDAECPLMSLPLALGTTPDTIPAAFPYLEADVAKTARWLERFDEGDHRPRIGIAWSARLERMAERRRGMRMEDLAVLAGSAACCFVSLQKGLAREPSREPVPGIPMLDWTNELTSFADTAALISALDLVITVDTAVAHLAGALGKPVWIVLPWVVDWRWQRNRDDSPWYPSARLFRQQQAGEWAEPLRRIREELSSFCVSR